MSLKWHLAVGNNFSLPNLKHPFHSVYNPMKGKWLQYNVHPVPPPNSEIIERIKKRYETKRIKIEKLLTLGYTTSGDP